ncbi:MAG: DUF45 domain-containing protein [Clostridia bacterium]|nr:DUF45 domain-containing protein [Clostridia bacterium]
MTIRFPSAPSDMAGYKSERGGFEYTVTRKSVKNINIRVREDGSVAVSAPYSTPERRIISFVEEKSLKIAEIIKKLPPCVPSRAYSSEEKSRFLEKAEAICRSIEPMFFEGEYKKPRIELCSGKSRWGYCFPKKNLVRLNISLCDHPDEIIEYVAMHEYCHFLVANHSASFYYELERRMPDWRKRKASLNGNLHKNAQKT